MSYETFVSCGYNDFRGLAYVGIIDIKGGYCFTWAFLKLAMPKKTLEIYDDYLHWEGVVDPDV